MTGSDHFLLSLRTMTGGLEESLSGLWGQGRSGPAARALADVYVTEDPPAVTVELDVAGVDPDALDVVLDGDRLTVRGERTRPPGERRQYQHAEIEWGPFERRLRLGVAVDADRVTARYERGILTIVLPLAASRPPSRVPVTIRAQRP
jgi:HSP20 family protein